MNIDNKKSKKKIAIAVLIIAIILICGLIIMLPDSDSPFIGSWKYKYTYVNDQLYYTEEDGMEQYIELMPRGKYKYADYCDDVVEYGWWFEIGNKAYLINMRERLDVVDKTTLQTNVKDGKRMMMPGDFYNVLVKK